MLNILNQEKNQLFTIKTKFSKKTASANLKIKYIINQHFSLSIYDTQS